MTRKNVAGILEEYKFVPTSIYEAMVSNGRCLLSDVSEPLIATAIIKEIEQKYDNSNSTLGSLENVEIFDSMQRFKDWFFDEPINKNQLEDISIAAVLTSLAEKELSVDDNLLDLMLPPDAITLSNGYVAFMS